MSIRRGRSAVGLSLFLKADPGDPGGADGERHLLHAELVERELEGPASLWTIETDLATRLMVGGDGAHE